jgi:quinol monooxygenase YgiN
MTSASTGTDRALVAVATMRPREGEQPAVLDLLLAAAPEMHAEDGCELYAVHEGKDRIVIIEKWSSSDALRAHGGGDQFKALSARLEPLLASPMDVQIVRPRPAGTSAGSL